MSAARLRVRLVALVAAGLVTTACGGGENVQRQPEGAADGIQLTGVLDGGRVAVSRGNPTVTLGDCDFGDGLDDDLCIVSRTIDGLTLNLVIENPAVLTPGAELAVRDVACASACDDVRDAAVVELRVDGDPRPAESGTLRVDRRDERRVAATFDLALPGEDRVRGRFDVPLPRRAPVPTGPPDTPTPSG